jgi:MFS family permease
VLINAFVGAMVGMERSVLPLLAETEFSVLSHTSIVSFLISFGIVKAICNLFAGRFSDTYGRKRLLIVGWLTGIPVPFLLMWAPTWDWVVAANILLGINQGLCWSTTVIMKIDLAGPDQRGFAMGLNEFAGYLAVAVTAYTTASIADSYGLRPYPFYLGVVCSLSGLILSVLFIKDTHGHAQKESEISKLQQIENRKPNIENLSSHLSPRISSSKTTFADVFLFSSFRSPALFSCSQAGLVNNLNDGMVWGLFPIFFASLGLSLEQIGFLAALYPAVWGIAQLITGVLSDNLGRKWMIVFGMWIQAIGISVAVFEITFNAQVIAALLLGIGTAMVYPTLLAAVSDSSHPGWRASAVGVYRFWRDLGYAIGALLSGVVADLMGISFAILFIGVLTFFSGTITAMFFTKDSSPPAHIQI